MLLFRKSQELKSCSRHTATWIYSYRSTFLKAAAAALWRRGNTNCVYVVAWWYWYGPIGWIQYAPHMNCFDILLLKVQVFHVITNAESLGPRLGVWLFFSLSAATTPNRQYAFIEQIDQIDIDNYQLECNYRVLLSLFPPFFVRILMPSSCEITLLF